MVNQFGRIRLNPKQQQVGNLINLKLYLKCWSVWVKKKKMDQEF